MTGTGFFYFRRVKGSEGHEILVTNRHVVEDAVAIKIHFHEENPDGTPNLGEIGTVTVGCASWRFHPNADVDVAFFLMVTLENDLAQVGGAFHHNIDFRLIPSETDLMDVFPIDDVIFIGYPNGIFDPKNYLPIVRRGVTATPLYVDYNRQPQFLISASVFPGSSGSPVFLYNVLQYTSRAGSILGESRIWFLGILSEFKYREALGWLEFDDTPVLKARIAAQESLDIGIVFKERTIREALDYHLTASGFPPKNMTRT